MKATDCECMLLTKGRVSRDENCKLFPLFTSLSLSFLGSCFKYFAVEVSQVLIASWKHWSGCHFSVCLLCIDVSVERTRFLRVKD